jgi:hypothetical protein
MEKVTVVYIGTCWLFGKLEKRNGQLFLYEPRIYVFNTKIHGCMCCPGDPPFIPVTNNEFYYELPVCEAYDKYMESISVIDVPQSPIITVN